MLATSCGRLSPLAPHLLPPLAYFMRAAFPYTAGKNRISSAKQNDTGLSDKHNSLCPCLEAAQCTGAANPGSTTGRG